MTLIRRGTIWHYDITFDGVRYQKTTLQTSKMLGREVEAKKLRDLREGIIEHPIEDLTFKELSKKYLKLHGRGRKFHTMMMRVLVRHFGKRLLSEIEPVDVDEFLAARRGSVGNSAFNQSLSVLKQSLNLAVAWHHLRASPAAHAKRAKVPKGRERFLTEHEGVRLLRALTPWVRRIVLAAIHTGARQGELLGLLWEDVDLEHGFVTFRETKNGEPKTTRLSKTMLELLEDLPSRREAGHVFRNHGGDRIHRDGLTWSFRRGCVKAGVVGLRFHDLRHSTASFLVQAGEPLNTVRDILGHKSIAMTLRYAHLAPDHHRQAMDVLDGLAFSRDPAKSTAVRKTAKARRTARVQIRTAAK